MSEVTPYRFMSTVDAAKHYLDSVARSASVEEITAALIAGGWSTTLRNPRSAVAASLRRSGEQKGVRRDRHRWTTVTTARPKKPEPKPTDALLAARAWFSECAELLEDSREDTGDSFADAGRAHLEAATERLALIVQVAVDATVEKCAARSFEAVLHNDTQPLSTLQKAASVAASVRALKGG